MSPIRFHRGVGSGLALVVFISGLLLMELFQYHPVLACVLGAVLASVVLAVVVYMLWQLVRKVCALSDDPYTRTTPYRKIEIDLDAQTRDVLQEPTAPKNGKDQTPL